jgi:hypothetical protein
MRRMEGGRGEGEREREGALAFSGSEIASLI